MKNKNLDESRDIAKTALQGDYIPPTDAERNEVKQFQQKENKVDLDDERLKLIFQMQYDRSKPTTFNDFKKEYLQQNNNK